jgi:hypothetical protein
MWNLQSTPKNKSSVKDHPVSNPAICGSDTNIGIADDRYVISLGN